MKLARKLAEYSKKLHANANFLNFDLNVKLQVTIADITRFIQQEIPIFIILTDNSYFQDPRCLK